MNLNDAIHTAVKYANQGMSAQAEEVCRQILTANNNFHPAYHLLSQLAFQQGKDDLAVQMIEKAIMLDGNRPNYHRDLAEILCISGKPDKALTVLQTALSLNPNDPKSHYVAGMALTATGNHEKAISAYNTVIRLDPNHGKAYNNLGALFEIFGQRDKAKAAYITAVKLNKNHVEAQNNLAAVLVSEGDINTAKEHLEIAIKAQPSYMEAHHNLSALKRYKESDGDFKHLLTLSQNITRLPFSNQVRLSFILGKAYSDIKEYDTAFRHYEAGNKMMRAHQKYDEKAEIKSIRELKSVFSKDLFKNARCTKSNDQTPVFIVGMPRSGSTLIEQILSSHSSVHAAGELPLLGDIIRSNVKNFPNGIISMSDNDLKKIGEEYLKHVKRLNPGAKRIVDKMPGNFLHAGLIAKILPGAHIINSCRDPIDTCFSNYTRLFLHTIPYAYDLGELGRHYNRYQDLMDHWHDILPEETLIDVHYENIVQDIETEARKLIRFVGLEWQDRCLKFHKNKRAVHTASAAQVRQPIYKTSVEKWRPYEKHLGPLIEALNKN